MANPKHKVDISWSSNLSYALGVIASDGNISPNLRHINITSKDKEMVMNIREILLLDNKIGRKSRGGEKSKKYFVLQFGDVRFVRFMQSIGLHPNKSKTIGSVKIPDKYFCDFVRGVVDGDGNISNVSHPASQHMQTRIRIACASRDFLEFLLKKIKRLYGISGGFITHRKLARVHILTFAKADSLQLLPILYYAKALPSLSRKRYVAEDVLSRYKDFKMQ